jgi:hypothetical protein
MKREKLLEQVHDYGTIFIRHGRKHDIYENPRTMNTPRSLGIPILMNILPKK